MTMVPARNLVQYTGYGRYYTGGGGGGGGTHTAGNTTHAAKFELSSDLAFEDPMAEEESRTTSLNEAGSSKHVQEENEEQEVDDRRDERWLQLGLGSHSNPIEMRHDQQSSRFVELDLFPDRRQPAPPAQTRQYPDESSGASLPIVGPPLFFPHPVTSLTLRQNQPETTWGGRRLGPWTPMPTTSMMPFYSQSYHQQQHPYGIGFPPASFEAGGPSSNIRLIDAPRRPQAGIWFVLQASQNQRKEPTLPQISKSYLRIKDGRMTVRLLMKYLANKLGLNNESEVEITCKGQLLSSLMMLQQVRDNIWCSRDAITLLPDSNTTDHVMVLRYGRSG
ncbi:protein LAX PANICLE 2-like [Aristolochia californica]|uniref:protein LAX PANICLE 2-like n=1 Tax=Aristolochia californica TaxID=171875 RepID=UPI0035DBFB35